MSAAAPLADEAEFARYQVQDRLEIVAALRALIAAREPLALHADGSAEFAVSIALAVDAARDLLYVDCVADPFYNRRLTRAGAITLAGLLDGVQLRFAAGPAEADVYDERPALRLALPATMLRVQRRETFRVATPLLCQLALTEEGRTRVVEMRVADLSQGGVALVSERNCPRLEIGQVLEGCRIALNADDVLHVALEVRNVAETTTRIGARQVRAGCCFVGLDPAQQVLVARAVAHFERSRRALA
jgi:c-di-GMP-binding flagellar brake protein YcgR